MKRKIVLEDRHSFVSSQGRVGKKSAIEKNRPYHPRVVKPINTKIGKWVRHSKFPSSMDPREMTKTQK